MQLGSATTGAGYGYGFSRKLAEPTETLYITCMRRDVREVVSTKGLVVNASYPADNNQSTCHIAQILSLSQLLSVSVPMVQPSSQDLSSQAKSSARSGLPLTPRLGESGVSILVIMGLN